MQAAIGRAGAEQPHRGIPTFLPAGAPGEVAVPPIYAEEVARATWSAGLTAGAPGAVSTAGSGWKR